MNPVVRGAGRVRLMTEPPWCIVWTGKCDNAGYPIARVDGHTIRVHRLWAALAAGVALEDLVDLEVHHTCRNSRCLTPEHLMVLTHAQHGRVHRLGPGSVRPYRVTPGRAQLLGRPASADGDRG